MSSSYEIFLHCSHFVVVLSCSVQLRAEMRLIRSMITGYFFNLCHVQHVRRAPLGLRLTFRPRRIIFFLFKAFKYFGTSEIGQKIILCSSFRRSRTCLRSPFITPRHPELSLQSQLTTFINGGAFCYSFVFMLIRPTRLTLV